MSITTYTSSERPEETQTTYPPCCDRPPILYVWKRKGLASLLCQNPKCDNHAGVLGYSEQDALERWKHYRHDRQYLALIAARVGVVEHRGTSYALTWDAGE